MKTAKNEILFVIYILSLLLFSCSSIYYAKTFNINSDSEWIKTNNGSYVFFENKICNNLIGVGYLDFGKLMLMGPPYLPVLPVFFLTQDEGNPHNEGNHHFYLYLYFEYNDSLIFNKDKIKYILNNKETIKPFYYDYLEYIDSNYKNSKYTHKIEYEMRFFNNIDGIETIEIMFDSVKVNNTVYSIQPLKLKMGKKLYHKLLVN